MSGLKILIVEDHEDSAEALSRLLRHAGHTVATARTFADATAFVADQPLLDLLISDIALPDGDGCELLRWLCERRGGAVLPAIALTGHGEEHWADACKRAGYRDLLVKPVVYEQLLAAVRSVCEHRDLPTALGGVPSPAPLA
jgi:two-component system CheB/CheR fusion protein